MPKWKTTIGVNNFQQFGYVQNLSSFCFTLLFCEWIECEKFILNSVIISFFKWNDCVWDTKKGSIEILIPKENLLKFVCKEWVSEKWAEKNNQKNENLWDTQNCLQVSKSLNLPIIVLNFSSIDVWALGSF